jgi:hypothetical protein
MSHHHCSAASLPLADSAAPWPEAQFSLFGLSDLAHVDNPVQAFAHPLPGVSRLVLGPLPVGQPQGLFNRCRRLRVLAVSESGSHFVAPTVMYNGECERLIQFIQWQIAQYPLVHRFDEGKPAARRHLRTVHELTDPVNWHLWLGSPDMASPCVWQWASLATEDAPGSTGDERPQRDPVDLVAQLGAVRLQRCVQWALQALTSPSNLLTERPALPQSILLELMEKLSASPRDEAARRYVTQALSTLPLGHLRWLAERSADGNRLFEVLCSGGSLPRAIRRECPLVTPSSQRHATRCSPAAPDASASTWRLALQALPLIARQRWPATHDQWRCLLHISRRAEITANAVGAEHDLQAVLDAISVAAQHAVLGQAPRVTQRSPHWAMARDSSGVPDAASLASQLLTFRSHTVRALQLRAAEQRVTDSAKPTMDRTFLERLVTAFAYGSERAFAQEVVSTLEKCPAVKFGTLTIELIKSPTEAARVGVVLDNCLQGTGNWRFAQYLLSGKLLAQMSDAGRLVGLFTVHVARNPRGPGIVASAGDLEGPGNTDAPARMHRAAYRYARMLQDCVFGLDLYASITQCFRAALR